MVLTSAWPALLHYLKAIVRAAAHVRRGVRAILKFVFRLALMSLQDFLSHLSEILDMPAADVQPGAKLADLEGRNDKHGSSQSPAPSWQALQLAVRQVSETGSLSLLLPRASALAPPAVAGLAALV